MFALRYFDVSGFLEVVYNHLANFTSWQSKFASKQRNAHIR